MKRSIFVAALVVPVFFLGACGGDGGQADPNEHSADTEYHDGIAGNDVKDIETYDANVQVQVIEVGGYECVLAVRGGSSDYGMAIDCPSAP